jgi:hypothetical protein
LAGYLVGDLDRDQGWHQLHVARDGDGLKLYRGGRCRSRRWKGHARERAVRLEEGTDPENVGLVEDEVGPDLMGWCERFCRDPSPVKTYVSSLDAEFPRPLLILINRAASPSPALSKTSTPPLSSPL